MFDAAFYHLCALLGYLLSLAAGLQTPWFRELPKSPDLARITWFVPLATGKEGMKQPSDVPRFIGVEWTALSRA